MVRRRWLRGWRSTGPHCSNFGSGGGWTAAPASGRASGAGSATAAVTGAAAPADSRSRAHVVVGDAAARSASSDSAQIHSELARQAAGCGRRGHRAGAGARIRRLRRDGGRPLSGRGRSDATSVGWRGRGWRAASLRGSGCGAGGIGEAHEHGADLHGLSRLHVHRLDAAAHRGGDLDLRLVRLDLDQRRVFLDDVALAHVDRDDLGLGQSLPKVRQPKLAGHVGDPNPPGYRAAGTSAGCSNGSRCEAAPAGRTRGVLSLARSRSRRFPDSLASPAAPARETRACGRGRQRSRWACFTILPRSGGFRARRRPPARRRARWPSPARSPRTARRRQPPGRQAPRARGRRPP